MKKYIVNGIHNFKTNNEQISSIGVARNSIQISDLLRVKWTGLQGTNFQVILQIKT